MARTDTIDSAADRTGLSPAACLSLLAIVVLGTRFVQGFIFWGGASRRLFYDFHEIAGVDHAVKLDFNAAGFVANKLTHALPGTLWIQAPLEWTLQHPGLIVASVWLWTFAELAVGLGLIFGLATRLAALASIGLNISLMLIFGWMGSTCLDEWTMAVSGVAMSSAVFLAGGGRWSLDAWLIDRTGWAQRRAWTPWIFSGPVSSASIRRLGLLLAAVAAVFTVGTYNILFGAVVSPLHPRVNFHRYTVEMADVQVAVDGSVQFGAYVSSGPDTAAAYIVSAKLVDSAGAAKAAWDGAALAGLADTAIVNVYPYVWASGFRTEKVGFSGTTGARATITLPSPAPLAIDDAARYELILEAIDGTTWSAPATRTGG